MRLLNCSTLQLEQFDCPTTTPPYAILSHCWEEDEVLFDDIRNSPATLQKKSFFKVQKVCLEARLRGLGYAWIDTCCIDKTSSGELSEAVNSMFQWYHDAEVCYAYLGDLDADEGSGGEDGWFSRSRWFSRGWTLQELIAPKDVEFFDRNWTPLGSKLSLLSILSWATGIDSRVLEDSRYLPTFSIGKRLSWAAQRQTRRIEDIAYSLLGIFGVNMPIIYGEGSKAFLRLQEEILKIFDDATLFAWKSLKPQQFRGLLAESPSEFAHFASVSTWKPSQLQGEIQLISSGIVINDVFGVQGDTPEPRDLILRPWSQELLYDDSVKFGILLREWRGRFIRVFPQRLLKLVAPSQGSIPMATRRIVCFRTLDSRVSSSMSTEWLLNTEHGDTFSKVQRQDHKLEEKQPNQAISEGLIKNMPLRPACTMFDCAGSFDCHYIQGQPGGSDEEVNMHSYRSGIPDDDDDDVSREEAESEDDDQLDLLMFTMPDPPKLDPNHQLTRHLDAATHFALEAFLRSVSHNQVPAKRQHDGLHPRSISPHSRKRLKSDLHSIHIPVSDREDPAEPETIMIDLPPQPSYSFFACPFYVRDRESHQECLTRASLHDIKALKVHIATMHKRPIACPICVTIFETKLECDSHIRERSCNTTNLPPVEGVTDAQTQMLLDRAEPGVPEREQWFDVWNIVFPREAPPPTAYLSSRIESVEMVVCVVRRFWAKEGESIVTEFLRVQGLEEVVVADVESVVTLRTTVLNQMIDQLVEGFKQDEAKQHVSSGVKAVVEVFRQFVRFLAKQGDYQD